MRAEAAGRTPGARWPKDEEAAGKQDCTSLAGLGRPALLSQSLPASPALWLTGPENAGRGYPLTSESVLQS